MFLDFPRSRQQWICCINRAPFRTNGLWYFFYGGTINTLSLRTFAIGIEEWHL